MTTTQPVSGEGNSGQNELPEGAIHRSVGEESERVVSDQKLRNQLGQLSVGSRGNGGNKRLDINQ